MGNNLFVTGFPYEMTQEELGKLFSEFGTVLNVKILVERETGRSRGIAFVLMATESEADAAMKKLNGSMVGERKIFVIEAKPAEKAEAGYTGPERRSGKDRRRSPPAAVGVSSARRPWDKAGKPSGFGTKKPWEKKPWDKDRKPSGFGTKKPWDKDRKPGGFGDKKPWEKKPWDKDRKPGGFGDKKPWEKKPWDKDRKPGGFGDKKPWEKKPWDKDRRPGGFGDKKPWDKKPWDKDRKPSSFADKKPGLKKPWDAMHSSGGPKKWGPGGPNSGRKPGDFKSKPGGFKQRPSGGFRG